MKFIDENNVQLTGDDGKSYNVKYSDLPSLGFTSKAASDAKNMYMFGGNPSILQSAVEMLPGLFAAVGAVGGSAIAPVVGTAAGAAAGYGAGYATRDILRDVVGTKAYPKTPAGSLQNVASAAEGSILTGASAGVSDLVLGSLLSVKNANFLYTKVTDLVAEDTTPILVNSEIRDELTNQVMKEYGSGYIKYIPEAMADYVDPITTTETVAGRNAALITEGEAFKPVPEGGFPEPEVAATTGAGPGSYVGASAAKLKQIPEGAAGTPIKSFEEVFGKTPYEPGALPTTLAEPTTTGSQALNARRQIYQGIGYDAATPVQRKQVDQALARVLSDIVHTHVPETQTYDQMYHLLAGLKASEKVLGGYSARASIRYLLIYPLLRGLLK